MYLQSTSSESLMETHDLLILLLKIHFVALQLFSHSWGFFKVRRSLCKEIERGRNNRQRKISQVF